MSSTEIVPGRPAVDMTRLKKADDALRDPWPGNMVYDAKLPMAHPLFNDRMRGVMSLGGYIASSPWAQSLGLKLELVGIQGPQAVRRLMWNDEVFPPEWDKTANWKIYQIVYRRGGCKLAGRAALAEFFGLGEWDTGVTFELYLDNKTTLQREATAHRLENLISILGG